MAETSRTILVAMDESDHSFHALKWSLDVLCHPQSSSSQDRFVLVHAKVVPVILGSPALIVGADLITAMDKHQDLHIEGFLNKALELCRQKQVRAETKVAIGDPRDVICEMVETVNADLLVVGSHSYGTIKRALLGSVSDYCAHHAKCPVFIVKKTHHA